MNIFEGSSESHRDAVWEHAVNRLRGQVSPQNFDMWIAPIECVAWANGTLRLRAPNSYVRLWFESNFVEAIKSEVNTLVGAMPIVEFEDPPEMRATAAAAAAAEQLAAATAGDPVVALAPEPDPAPPRPRPPTEPTRPAGPSIESYAPPEMAHLNPRYRFDTFVSGPSNQLAYAACESASNTFPPKYNPIFVCGGAGLGKTHLLHSIGHQQLRLRPSARIVYISSERFMNEYVNSIRTGSMHEFRRRYREGIDVLLVDDIQFLAGKDGTQDEFFHTFNALHEAQKQIVITADRKPYEISDIADRLRTRFAWGLLADIEPPELEVRIAILRKKAQGDAILLPDDVAMYIASSIKSNVRELEGALIRLAAYSSLSGRTIDLAFAQETLGGAITRPREVITVDSILRSVASYYGVKAADLKSERRHKSIAHPRAVAMYLARQHTKDSYPDLGRAFGGKHHTTIISAVEKIADRLKEDPALRGEIHAVESSILPAFR